MSGHCSLQFFSNPCFGRNTFLNRSALALDLRFCDDPPNIPKKSPKKHGISMDQRFSRSSDIGRIRPRPTSGLPRVCVKFLPKWAVDSFVLRPCYNCPQLVLLFLAKIQIQIEKFGIHQNFQPQLSHQSMCFSDPLLRCSYSTPPAL